MNATAILFVALLAQSSPMNAGQDAKSRAKVLLNEGSALYELGDIAGALEKFQEAHATYASPKIWFNIGQANRDLGRLADALAAFEKFLVGAHDASPTTLADARKAVAELKPRLGRVRIECQTPGAEVSIDGKAEGRAPLLDPIWVMPGRHQITALAADTSLAAQTVSVAAGTESLVDIKPNSTLVTASEQTPIPSPAVGSQSKENPYAGLGVTRPRIHEQPDGWWLGRKWTWVAAGSTVVFGTGAIIAGTMMQSKFDELRNTCGKGAGANWTGCTSDQISSLDTRKNVANVLWGLSAAAAVTTGVLFFVEGHDVIVFPFAGETTGLLANVRY